tara:strand:+ start:149 stop:325 length:177 start_codon:yes stop_codon:yes gene_type:complete
MLIYYENIEFQIINDHINHIILKFYTENKKYYEDNREKIKENKKYYEDNREKIKEYKK